MSKKVLLVVALLAAGCGPDAAPTADSLRPVEREPGGVHFSDATATAGIDFEHHDSVTDRNTILETMGSGLAWVDYDSDGRIDLLFIQDGPLPPKTEPKPTHKLYRNLGGGKFEDVTTRTGLNRTGYGQGVAVGDYDNDGFDDLAISYFGKLELLHNVADSAAPGGRKFVDVSAAARIANPHWGTSLAWGDLTGDGKLDLYVCNYCEIDLERYQPCWNEAKGANFICPPTVFEKVPHKLFTNNGDGTFTDATATSGIAGAAPGGGLAVVILDLDGDGKQDIYAVNDLGPAFAFQNLGGGKFKERGMLSGAGLDRNGRFMAGMGIAAGDIDGSSRPSLAVSNYQDEPTEIFLNKGNFAFTEWNHPSGVGPATLRTLGFGIELFDADRDGHLDLVQANGHVYKNANLILGIAQPQAAQMFIGDGNARFREITPTAGDYFQKRYVGRGVAVADWDDDGRPDLAFSHNAGPGKLLRNETENGHHGLRLELRGDGVKSNRNAIGAKVTIEVARRKLTRWIHGGGSYLSASDRRLIVGLGSAVVAEKVTIAWPSGAVQTITNLAADRPWLVVEGRDPAPRVKP